MVGSWMFGNISFQLGVSAGASAEPAGATAANTRVEKPRPHAIAGQKLSLFGGQLDAKEAKITRGEGTPRLWNPWFFGSKYRRAYRPAVSRRA